MRRVPALVVFLAALLLAAPAGAEFRPVKRDFGELHIPRLRAGTVHMPAGHQRGRLTVVVRLAEQPLALAGRTFAATSAGVRKLDLRSTSSRAYLTRLEASQRAAVAQLERAIPEASVQQRYRVVLNGLAVELPASSLPTLVRQSFATRVYPSLRYTLALDQSPGLIKAGAIAAATGARGDSVKIGIVDDGIDQGNAFFDPAGFQYPAGFPKGGTRWTTPKVIVARVFPGPGSGKGGRLAVDPQASFHGTHVAGIAAGNAGTTAPAGGDHPSVAGLSGVAPRAWLGNYRVFTVPTPIGHVANTPEIVAAFEAAVEDGMDVVNFSGGGPQSDPVNDALNEAVSNMAAAGVVPVISAGNDRDEFGYGTAGSPGTAPEAISVAAASNTHVFSPGLDVVAPGAPSSLHGIPFIAAPGHEIPPAWGSNPQALVDIGTIVGIDGSAVDRRLCGPAGSPNEGAGTLPNNSLQGAIALVSRGQCTFASKAERAKSAGAIGLILGDNRPGEANAIPVDLAVPAGMISDLDSARLRVQAAATGGRTTVQIGRSPLELGTGRGGTITSFSSAGPTAFGHLLKPDVSAPGGQILSATLPRAGGPFAVFDGTSMAAPHVAGAAALLRQRHPAWTPAQVKSALVTTAAPAWSDTGRTVEAPVTLGGGGLVDLQAADNPQLFAEPASLSFGDLDVTRGERSKGLLVQVTDAIGGAGTWLVELRPQAATAGASLAVPGTLDVFPGGIAALPAVARATAGAEPGENYGFLVLRRGEVTRRIPYLFLVTRPALASMRARPLQLVQQGDTRRGTSVVSAYRYPTAPFGPSPSYNSGAPVVQPGGEALFSFSLNEPVANFGVTVIGASANSAVDPWVLGSKDENDVQGYAGTPVNVNSLTFGFRADIGVAGAAFPRPKTYYVTVDSASDEFTGRAQPGSWVLQAWVNDVFPPVIRLLTTRVSAGRPTIAARVVDPLPGAQSGVDPLSLVLSYRGVLVGAATYDPVVGIALFPLPRQAPALRVGQTPATLVASDNQESKNVNTSGESALPNTAAADSPLRVVNGPTATWLAPEANVCLQARTRLAIVAGSTAAVRSVRFYVGERLVATDRSGTAGLYLADWRRGSLVRGRHILRAVAVDAEGREATAQRRVRVCRAATTR